MKKTKLILALACMALAPAVASANSADEKAAMKDMNNWLITQRLSPRIDSENDRLVFRHSDVLYWITFEGNDKKMLYTLHRQKIDVSKASDSRDIFNRKQEVAIQAANLLNAEKEFKTYVNGNRVDMEFPVYATSVVEYQHVFPSILNLFKGAEDAFQQKYKRGRNIVDSIHNHWMDIDTTTKVVSQPTLKEVRHDQHLKISNFQLRSIDHEGNTRIAYDQSLRKADTHFLQPKIKVTADKKGLYKIGMRIMDSKGKLYLPSKRSNYTTVSPVDIEKEKKEMEVELVPFGGRNDRGTIWPAGDYTIEFFEDETPIYRTSFTVL